MSEDSVFCYGVDQRIPFSVMGRVFVSKDHVFCDGVSGIVRGFYFLRWGEWLTSEDANR